MKNYCGGYLRIDLPGLRDEVSESRDIFFERQTLHSTDKNDETAIKVFCGNIQSDDYKKLPLTLLEQMTWALLTRPGCDIMIQPLYVTIFSEFKTIIEKPSASNLKKIIDSGFVAVTRMKIEGDIPYNGFFDIITRYGFKVSSFSQAIFQEKDTQFQPVLPEDYIRKIIRRVLDIARRKLPLDYKIRAMQILTGVRLILGIKNRNRKNDFQGKYLATRKSWNNAEPVITVKASPNDIQGRIPVLIAVHWLELGGAEKFAVDLIKKLPKNIYAVYVTTDVLSSNSWAKDLEEHVEEIYHIPDFLPPYSISVFYKEYIHSRGIRLLHIHHAPKLYESLFFIRRFFPDLVVLDTLHIIELPPNSGGYPEIVGRELEPFINHHHVISKLLAKFLIQRWMIPEKKISVVYLNVDTDYFNPDIIEKNMLRSEFGISGKALLIGFIGRFVRQKQPLVFVEMAKCILEKLKNEQRAEEIYFVMVGGGPLISDVQKRVAHSGLDQHLFIHNEVSDTRPVYRDLDLLIMPSENEGLALVTYEAMAMNVPVIISDVGAQSELLPEQFLVSLGEDAASRFANKVLSLLEDTDKLKTIGEDFRRYILEHHRSSETFEKMIALYENLLK